MSQSILYYPSISIEDGVWLRNACLYWDEVCSIVPNKDYDDFPPEISYLKQRNQYRAIYPEDIFTLGNPLEFEKIANKYFSSSMPLPSTHRIHSANARSYKYRIDDSYLYSLIYYGKIPPHTKDMLARQGIVANENGWIEMPRSVVENYMKILAEFAAKYDSNDMVIGSDRMSELNDLFAINDSKSKVPTISVVFNKCLPVPAMDVGFEQILDFKEKRKNELLQLRQKIRELEDKISNCENDFQLKSVLSAFKESWQLELLNSEKLFHDEKIDYVMGSLCSLITAASNVATLAEFVNNIKAITASPFVGAAVGLGGLIGACKHVIDNKTICNKSGFAYIVSAEKNGLIDRKSKIDMM